MFSNIKKIIKGTRLPEVQKEEQENSINIPRVDDIENTETEDMKGKSELVIALVAATGCELDYFTVLVKSELELYGYNTDLIRISSEFLSEISPPIKTSTKLKQIDHFMTVGNEYRDLSDSNSALAYSAISLISKKRLEKLDGEESQPIPKQAWIIRSLKNPEEVIALRTTYGDSLFIFGIYSSQEKRKESLNELSVAADPEDFVEKLIKRDADEGPSNGHGQHTSDTFHLADFFVDVDKSKEQNKFDIERIFKLIFANPYITPTFDEYAMYMAFSASTRSGDLSRQVGAVLCKDENILSTGANDVPKSGGGLYWPIRNDNGEIVDLENGRDYTRGFDANKAAVSEIIEEILHNLQIEYTNEVKEKLQYAKVNDITEYGRVVHAEMEAILSCARSNNSTKDSILFCTTFPCHNCAKHIIAAGIKRVIYVEPYSKSKASEFHEESVLFEGEGQDRISFEPFVGVGPRNFLHLFSMKLGGGTSLKRKGKSGKIVDWSKESAILRLQPDEIQYIKQETIACSIAEKHLNEYQKNKQLGNAK